jgi:DNA-binding IclR family transcriptional regulator
VKQAGDILFCLAGNHADKMSLVEICAHVGVSGSKAFGILEALQGTGLVKRGRDGKGYALGPGLVTLSRKVLDDLTPARLAEPVLEELTTTTGSTSVLGLLTGDTVYVAAKRESVGDIRTVARVGHIMPLTYGAHGKVIAAFLTKDEQERILKEEDLYFHGNPGKLDRARLAEELAECRLKGFACDFGESAQGVNVVAAPVMSSASRPIGFVEVFILASPEVAAEFGPLVARAGKVLSRQLGAEIE